MKRIRKGSFLAAIVLIVMLIGLAGCSSSKEPAGEPGDKSSGADGKPVKISAVTAWPKDNVFNKAFWALKDKVEEKSEGKVTIEWKGGPETIPTFELSEAVRTGAVDLAWTAQSYSLAAAPALDGMKLSTLKPWEEREKGINDFWNEKIYGPKLNTYYLGNSTPGLGFNLYTLKPIEKVEDFKGMTIRVSPSFKSFVEALGGASVTTDPGEVYTALERNMVQGYGWPNIGITNFGWEEVTKYVIEPPFHAVNVQGQVNLDKWNSYPEDVQNVLIESMKEVELEMEDTFKQLIAEEREKMKAKGMEIIELAPEEAEKYRSLAYDSGWEEVMATDKAIIEEYKSLLEK